MMTKSEYREIFESEFLDGKIERRATVEEHICALDDLPEIPEWATLFWPGIGAIGTYRIDIPHSKDRLAEFRKLLGKKWRFKSSYEYDRCTEHTYANVENELVTLDVVMQPSMDGSSCKVIQVGEETVPIFEISCDE